MRVVLTCNYSPWSSYRGGGQVSTHQLGSALSRLGHDVHVVFTKSARDSVKVPTDLPYTLWWSPFVALKSQRQSPLRPFNAIGVAKIVRQLVGSRRDVVVHSQGEEGVLIPRFAPAAPWILTPRYPNYPQALLRDGGPSTLEHVALWLMHTKYALLRTHARDAAFVCPTSEAAARMVATALVVNRDAIRVVPNGIEQAFLDVQRGAVASDAPIVFFGRVETTKGVDVLLDAYARLVKPPPLLVIGNGEYLDAARERARQVDGAHVTFQPWLSAPELAQTLARARCVVLPSREESFGNAMVETMAAGAPLLTTRVGALPEVTHNGELAWLVPPGDADALHRQLSQMLQDPEGSEARAVEARAWVAAHYSWKASAQAFLAVYEEALARREASRRNPQ